MASDKPTSRWRNVVFWIVLSIAVYLPMVWGFRALRDAGALGAMDGSEEIAAQIGLTLLFLAFFGALSVANAHRGAHFMEPEAAGDLRENSGKALYSWASTAAMGLALIVLSIGGPGGAVGPGAALAGTLVLLVASTALSLVVWRRMDELDLRLTQETGNVAFYLIVLIGGGWAMLAHLGFVAGPRSLDWVTMFTGFAFVAAVVAAGRRGLLKLR